MAQTDLRIQFDEVTYECQTIKGVAVVPVIGSKIQTRYGTRKVTDVVYDYAGDGSGDCDVRIDTTAMLPGWG